MSDYCGGYKQDSLVICDEKHGMCSLCYIAQIDFQNEILQKNYDEVASAYSELRQAMFDLQSQASFQIHSIKADNESLRKDAELGRITLKYFDRMDDPADCDPLEKSVSGFLAKIRAAISSPENHS